MILRSYRYRIYPTAEQAVAMDRTADAVRFLYNLALEQRRDFWRQAKSQGVHFNYITQGRELTALRAECDWLAAIHSTPLAQALFDLDRAFAALSRGNASFPQFHTKASRATFRHKGSEAQLVLGVGKWALVKVPKAGRVKLRLTRPLRGRPVSVTFVRDALGWHVNFACEIEHEAAPSDLPPVGIDRGVANTLALSNGEMLTTPNVAQLDRRKRKAQHVLSRRVRGSNRFRKQHALVVRLDARMARVRADWQHRASTNIARRFGHVALEDLDIAAMTRKGRGKRGLNRSILEQGWNGFAAKLTYKLEERGGALVKVNPAYTSQQCSSCGTIDKASRESQASFACRHCGFAGHADTNAAVNILRRSAPIVEGSACAPGEARTDHDRLAA